MKSTPWFKKIAAFVVIAGFAATAASSARADLEAYVKAPDPAFAWEQTAAQATPAGTVYSIDLTSQVWHDITWKHKVRIYEPKTVAHNDTVLLFVTGGSHNSQAKDSDHVMGFALAKLCGARVAFLPQVPNQPLLGDKTEDALIAETFVRYLETKDETWPLLFPMAKSAVRAMDAVQAWAKKQAKPEVKNFIVTGASKRGWTTWLSGAVDDRVIGIAPMVIVMLNLGVQGDNQLKVWGKYSEQIEDYVNRGLMKVTNTPEGTKLWKMVDPYSFLNRLTKPKMLINGANDRYWTLDAIDLYWNDLKGPKYLVELPNAGHGLEKNREWALNGLGAFFRHTAVGKPLPQITWESKPGRPGEVNLTVQTSVEPKSARLWTASSDSRDFRESKWSSSPLPVGTTISGIAKKPADAKNIAAFIDLEYEVEGIPYHLTTSFAETTPLPAVRAASR
ncbi:MAG: phenylacetic acid degradation protein [Planctomycetes bacterium SCN 63-9]|nr:MAG: phenylacetic acid degradation protein [Planctomycetes bacterium SCN 63-9]